MRGRPGRYNVPEVRGAHDSVRPPPVQEPSPFASFVSRLGPPFCGRVQSLRWVQGELSNFGPPDFGPL
jgi:hypothetical protein